MNLIGEIVGYMAGLCTAICFLPQTIKTIKTKNVQGLSFWSYLIYNFGLCCWIFYGIYLNSKQMMIFNTIALVLGSVIFYMIIKGKIKK